ncbi:peptidoglycan synthetase FtsI [Tepidimonas ignava]|uniref:Peptidoglycan D,D-transpeptidase FtsI n=1 Tax=Tepidimonas ignava TaxID=114249 RepID=A0A4R3LBB3_9BURK|nr:penicillin-binding protein 2 [Tepidimonas ignava]TCS97431.1 peptidoglycan synthetase FtsI [Tepidimonas ignava]TSE22176.1 putative peptidoglycan D,D-transpeptidase PenA [Tepidimonas ignava]
MNARAPRSIPYGSSPLLTSATPVWRSRFVVAVLALAFVGLAARAAYVQVIGSDFFQRQGEVRYARTLELPASRGRILDRNGMILAQSVEAQSVWADPEDVDLDHPKLGELARLLGLPLPELRRRLQVDQRNFVWLRRQLDEPLAQRVKALGIPGVYLRKEYKRQYPQGEALAHVVGFTNVEDRGQEGVELAFERELLGKPGSRRVIKDRLGRIVEDVRDIVPPQDGRDLQLSIDARVQYFAFQRLKEAVQQHNARGGSAVVLDARTGEVLALANYPSYDPNNRRNLSGEQLRNRALTDSFEPGSTMKPFIAALALDKGLVRPDTPVQTAPGRLQMGGFTISDVHPYGVLTVAEIIQKSSNVGTVKLAMQLTPRDMWETYVRLGLGHKPQLPFPGATSGRLRAYQGWRPIEQATMAYGYGLSVSLVQLAQAYTVFARDGELLPLTLLRRDEPAQGVRVYSERNALAVRQMLHMVTSPGGTAQQAQTVGYSVGGKTGTARKQEGRGYAARKYRAFFVGLAPVESPRVVIAVMVDEPSNGVIYGGAVAAPVFADVAQQTLRLLGVAPDVRVQPQIIANAIAEEPV